MLVGTGNHDECAGSGGAQTEAGWWGTVSESRGAIKRRDATRTLRLGGAGPWAEAARLHRIATRSPRPKTLLVAEGNGGVDSRGAKGWEEAREQTGSTEDGHRSHEDCRGRRTEAIESER